MEYIMSKQKKLIAERFLVKNNLKHIYGVSVPTKQGEETKLKNIVLFPGYNSVKTDLWTEAFKNRMIKTHVEQGNLTVLEKDLVDCSTEEAVIIVSQVNDPRLLKIIKANDERAKVIDAANDKLEMILNPKYED